MDPAKTRHSFSRQTPNRLLRLSENVTPQEFDRGYELVHGCDGLSTISKASRCSEFYPSPWFKATI